MNVYPCMGGFCPLRDKCLHHTEPTNRANPAERKCEPGHEREMFFLARIAAPAQWHGAVA